MGVMDKSGTVYGLIDPECKELFYVGCTSQTPAKRLHGHVSAKAGTYSGNGARVKAYLARMHRRGYKPEMVILEHTTDAAQSWNLRIWESVHGWYGNLILQWNLRAYGRESTGSVLWFL
jgi:hypothetical protein